MSKSKPYMSFSNDDSSGEVPEDSSTVASPRVAPAPEKSASFPDYPPVEDHTMSVAAGRLPEEVYANTLPWWRAALRRKCVVVVEWESEVIGKWQARPHSWPALDPCIRTLIAS
jgi:hypothetical protein